MSFKRILASEEADDEAASYQEEKRPRIPGLRNVITEALMMNNLERVIVPVIRKVVSEEIDRALAKHIPAKLRSPPKQIQGSESRNLRLRFLNKLALPLFTGSRIEGDQNPSIQIALLDSSTGERITSGPESLQKVDIVVLEGDFGHDDEEEWTAEEFESYVVREREGKRPLLTGELLVSLKEGVGTLGELSFTDNSSWIRSRKFRLGARVQGLNHGEIRIREAKTEAFTVKDHRGELYKKHYPPALDDDVWRLDKVGKDGAFHKRLSSERINTVQEFLRVLITDPQRLRSILGSGMSNKMWDGTVEHAKTCVLNRKCYLYNAERQNISIIFDVIYQPKGVITEGRFLPMGELPEAEKRLVERLVKYAYEHWNEMIELEEEFLIGNPSYSLTLQPHIEVPGGHGDPNYQRTALGSQQDGQGPQIDLKSQVMGNRFMGHQQSMKLVNADWLHPEDSVNMVAPNQVAMVTSFMQQGITPPIVSPSLALGPRQAHVNPPNMAYQTTNLNPHTYRNGLRNQFEGPDGYYHSNSSNDLVSNLVSRGSDGEDLQSWFINGATAEQEYNFFPNTQGDQVFTFTGFPSTANLSFGDRLHGKAYVGWLKIKAALKWGISVRKVAAARRAKLEELED
uniref:Uncharacterized protein n=1 Tax=Araucaria cunninghamii TaxID=56994 RepID=A0A0D6QRK8_ARACU